MDSSKVIPLHPYNAIEIDDTRLQAMWRSHDRRQGMIYGVLALAGVAAILLAVAAVVWAAMSRQPAPQVKVDVQPPSVTVNVPKQEAPVVNITVPEHKLLPSEPQPAARADGAPPIVTEYVIFKEVNVGGIIVDTGWQYHNSTDTVPYHQWCYASISATSRLPLGFNGQPSGSLAMDAQALNLPEAQAQAWLKQCQWWHATGNGVTARYQNGAYWVDGMIDGKPEHLQIDTGSGQTILDKDKISLFGPLTPVGTSRGKLADGTISTSTLYEVHNICIGQICADKLPVIFESGVSLLGTDFIEAAHVSLAIKDGVMTLGGN
jgi:hypothetical protein